MKSMCDVYAILLQRLVVLEPPLVKAVRVPGFPPIATALSTHWVSSQDRPRSFSWTLYPSDYRYIFFLGNPPGIFPYNSQRCNMCKHKGKIP